MKDCAWHSASCLPEWWCGLRRLHFFSMIQLQVGQPIRAADASLLASGWLPKPDPAIEGLEQDSSGPTLPALSSCSGTGIGFCRYDYARDRQRLSVVTVPSPSSDVSGLVQRWWIE
eukprot:TRINITY_DN3372_c0_g1_i1.p1 TRINITY_DN3372_c0_g1~~TRINITY_DN3372_c0_g1_i1.p1  ORF type:complete len:116 (+),score=13.56 TRINITY_DN3372_c0_g1_i1:134-481(+)